MVILIAPEELEPEFQALWKLDYLKHLVIDYADNAIYATFEGKEVIIFRFKNYGFINDNRSNTYTVTAGPAGIMIHIKKT
jgi:hypothetical protein